MHCLGLELFLQTSSRALQAYITAFVKQAMEITSAKDILLSMIQFPSLLDILLLFFQTRHRIHRPMHFRIADPIRLTHVTGAELVPGEIWD